jgi:uncharacterized membrane protein YkvA (DUF1232 family)
MKEFVWVSLAVIIVGLLLLIGLAVFTWWRIQRSDEKKLAKRIAKLPFLDKISLAGALFADDRIPIAPRIIALALVLYIASPIDLLPDFIPVIGYFDDILIVIVGAGLLLRSVPRYILEEHVGRYEEKQEHRPAELPSGRG